MRAWPAFEVPELPGSGIVPLLHDQATGERRPSAGAPGSSGSSASSGRLYVCGITPYDSTHLGHTATYVAFDLLGRAWRDAGLEVRYVQNVTDVDDPLLERAGHTGEDWRELAARQIEVFGQDMAALRVLPPEHFVGATEAIELIGESVQKLEARGAAYRIPGTGGHDDVYFDVSADPEFGQHVARMSEAEMLPLFAERGGDPERPGKRHPLDSLLWLGARPGEPVWDSPLGPGRPGWHVECTAIALEHLGAGFDVQGGGSDLIFPHHENCAATSAVLGMPFARSYAYQGMVGLDGEKMSKSKGNLVFSSALRERGVDPRAIRLAVLAHHYREDWEWTDADLTRAERRLERWRTAADRSAEATGSTGDTAGVGAGAAGGGGTGDGGAGGGTADPSAGTVGAIRAAIADDLDAPGALAAVDAWADRVLADPSVARVEDGALVARACDALLGVRPTEA